MIHVLDSPQVGFFGLHGQFDSKYHVASPCAAEVTLVLKEFSCRMQVEKSLVAEV